MDASSSSSSYSERYRFNPTLAWNAEVEGYFIKGYGADHFARISKSLTHPSSYSCIRVDTLKTTSDSAIKKLASMLDHKITGDADIDAREQIVVIDFDHTIEEQSLNETSTPPDPSLDHGSMQVSGDNVESVCKCPYPGLDNVAFVQDSGPHLLWYDGQSG